MAGVKLVALAGQEFLQVNGLAGSDTFTVTPSATASIFVGGGDPIGTGLGDEIVLNAGGGVVTFEDGPEADSGAFGTTGNQRVGFDHIERAVVNNPGSVVPIAANDNDVITIIARDASTHAWADGVQDFTNTVNEGLEVLFLNSSGIDLNALVGCHSLFDGPGVSPERRLCNPSRLALTHADHRVASRPKSRPVNAPRPPAAPSGDSSGRPWRPRRPRRAISPRAWW